jgi:hypothetical protein
MKVYLLVRKRYFDDYGQVSATYPHNNYSTEKVMSVHYAAPELPVLDSEDMDEYIIRSFIVE